MNTLEKIMTMPDKVKNLASIMRQLNRMYHQSKIDIESFDTSQDLLSFLCTYNNISRKVFILDNAILKQMSDSSLVSTYYER